MPLWNYLFSLATNNRVISDLGQSQRQVQTDGTVWADEFAIEQADSSPNQGASGAAI